MRELHNPPVETVRDNEDKWRCTISGPYANFPQASVFVSERIERKRLHNINVTNLKLQYFTIFDIIIPKLKAKLEETKRILSSLLSIANIIYSQDNDSELLISDFLSLSKNFLNKIRTISDNIDKESSNVNKDIFDVVRSELNSQTSTFLSIPRSKI
jgi:hypothetical protein